MQGASGWRRCLHLHDILHQVLLEGRFDELKTDGDKLLQALKSDGVSVDGNEATMKRYLAL